MGLPIVTKIINEHSGVFLIRKNKNGKGTTIKISFPKFMLKEILVIDDNPDIRLLVSNILKDQNFEVRTAKITIKQNLK